ncbi:hypothetical protein Clacol_008626 [Clathrus columnatus]|uniref:Peptidase A1 domain-containing protein n=1 Tax=Clathrus columnatus TaxID=1419009 RepID=A0AAV5AKT6_9AGAM|nr:hypothetical protein Clacol_008626 [Clathrus columnatus]
MFLQDLLSRNTGSSDILVLTDQCDATQCGVSQDVALVPSTTLNYTDLNVHFEFGGAINSAEVNGNIASAPVAISNARVNEQFLGAIKETNLPFGQENLSGLVGAGFPAPIASPIEMELIQASLPSNAQGVDVSNKFLNTILSNAPLFTRLILEGQFEQPMFTVTLERETFEIGGNIGQLTLGGLPDGVLNDSLTWVPVRLYTPQQGGIPSPSDIPNEGTTAILGPQNVVNKIYSTIASSPQNLDPTGSTPPEIPCNVPVALTFVIGGKQFPLDPRDFFLQQSSTETCNADALQLMDTPSPTALMSWVLGATFMRSNLVAFYFGNFTHPSRDPPRIGFLSTVPANASLEFSSDVKKASASGGQFPGSMIVAPTGTFAATTTNSVGVAQQPTPISSISTPQESGRGDANGSWFKLK